MDERKREKERKEERRRGKTREKKEEKKKGSWSEERAGKGKELQLLLLLSVSSCWYGGILQVLSVSCQSTTVFLYPSRDLFLFYLSIYIPHLSALTPPVTLSLTLFLPPTKTKPPIPNQPRTKTYHTLSNPASPRPSPANPSNQSAAPVPER